MHKRFSAAGALVALAVSACGGGGNGVAPAAGTNSAQYVIGSLAQPSATTAPSNAVSNPGFESGSLSPWTSCGTVNDVSVTTAKAHSGSYSTLIGTTAKPEVDGTAAVCQTVTVPTGGTLTFWVYEGTTDTIEYVDQEADILSASGSKLTQLYSEAESTNGWEEKSFSLSAYAGQTVQLYFGVKGNGYSKDYVYEYLDDVSLTGSGASASPSPTASPTATPTSAPTATPSPAYACNNAGFDTDQSEFASGEISSDQLVDVCGQVTQVLAAKKTSSGDHGYFYVSVAGAASPGTIEIVSNLDAMGEDPNPPPTTWPWVAAGDYVYVQGRYYYDSSSSQGIDWTEDDTDSNWEHTGYVVVCNAAGTSCNLYE
ncbi:MAG TPA: carbohydrate binding domain-containing protein [Candidatus Baltobacteraceae bacterium]|nr:carbohydrate binding domain-containing protein [Candidatus Baltobacteraceae bacterium]